jgi:hypothetical protein
MDSVTFEGGSFVIADNVGLAGGQVVLNVIGGAVVSMDADQRVTGLNVSGGARVDLKDHDLIVNSTAAGREAALAELVGLVASGRNSGVLWMGPGIGSSVAAGDGLTGLGILLNDNGNGGAIRTEFDGQVVDENSILVKFTWNGDADLTGVVDASDYFRIDLGFANGRVGWANGDFDYSGTIDANDYFLIDKAFAGQAGVLGKVKGKMRRGVRGHHPRPAKPRANSRAA